MIDRAIDRLLWRCEFGNAVPEVVTLELRDRMQWLRDVSIDLRASTAVRLWNDALLAEYDAAFQSAARTLDLGTLRAAVQQIHRCERAITAMHELTEAHEKVERAAAAMEQIDAMAATPQLRRLPAVASLAQIVDIAKQCIVERRYTQASHVAETCTRLAESLSRKSPGDADSHAAIGQRISTVRELCISTRPFSDDSDQDATRNGTLSTLHSLFAGGYAVLAARLLSELEVQMSGRRRFLHHVQRKRFGSVNAVASDEELRALIRDRSWDGAVDYYRNLSIARHAGTLAEQSRRAEAVAVALRDTISPPETPHE